MSSSTGSRSLSRSRRNKGSKSIFDASVTHKRGEIALSSFSHLFCGALERANSTTDGYDAWKKVVVSLGKHVGSRALELYCFRENSQKRDATAVEALNFITRTVWKELFGKAADQLLLGNEGYLIFEQEPLTNKFVSPPKNSNVNVSVFIAGIIEGALEAAGFPPTVTVQFHTNGSTVFIVKF